MKIEWTAEGESLATLGDDSAKHSVWIEQAGGQCLAQVEALFRGANPVQYGRGNVSGLLVFRSGKSYSSLADALAAWKTEYGRINGQGSLVLTQGATTATFADALLRSVTVAEVVGVRWTFRYEFGITTVS